MTVLASARNKLERADKHIADVGLALQASLHNGPYSLQRDFRYQDPHVFSVVCRTDPREINYDAIMLIVGDAIHNLRAALDHCAFSAVDWSVVAAEQESNIQFPIFKNANQNNYADKINEIRDFSEDTKALLIELEVFRGGKSQDILDLHSIDIIDKHRKMIPSYSGVVVSGLLRQTYDNENGQRILIPEADRYIEPWNSDQKMWHTGQGSYYSVTVIESWNSRDWRGLETTGAKISTRLSFGQTMAFAGKDVHATLMELSVMVENVITEFEGMIAQRT